LLVGLIGALGLLAYNGSITSNVSNVVKPINSSDVIQFDFPFDEGELARVKPQTISEKSACFNSLEISQDSKIRYCSMNDLDQVPQVALIGDSHSAAAFEGTAYYFAKDHNLSVVNLAGRLFSNVVNAPKGNAAERDNYLGGFEVADFLDRRKDIKNVVMVARGFFYLNWAENFSIPNREISSKEDVFVVGLRELFERFRDRNIIFVFENPTLVVDPRVCKSQRPIKSLSLYLRASEARDVCSITRKEDDVIHKQYRQMISDVLKDFPNVVAIDPRDLLCDEEKCYTTASGRVLYSDKNHLNRNGSYLQGKQISDAFHLFKSD